MRITSTTSNPVMMKETTAAGPAALMTTPLPTNRPAPMTPPRAIIVMGRGLKAWRSPLEGAGNSVGRVGYDYVVETPDSVRCCAEGRSGFPVHQQRPHPCIGGGFDL